MAVESHDDLVARGVVEVDEIQIGHGEHVTLVGVTQGHATFHRVLKHLFQLVLETIVDSETIFEPDCELVAQRVETHAERGVEEGVGVQSLDF